VTLRAVVLAAVIAAGASVGTEAANATSATHASATRSALTLGFLDDRNFFADPVSGGAWLKRARAVNAQMVRTNLIWARVAPSRPPNPDAARDPAWPGYDWTKTDVAVRAASAGGLRVLLNFSAAPTWAEGPDPPKSHRAGTWRPNPAELGAFATAAARRYSGTFADATGPLPRVAEWQAWNEPNLDYYLAPQWRRQKGRLVPASPQWYRRMLNRVYAGVKSVQADATVVSAGTAPYGDEAGSSRMRPARFNRELLCLGSTALEPLPCPDPAHFDALDHHPYSIAGPRRHAINDDDVGIPDLSRLIRPLKRAERAGRALPAGRKALWITEISWDSAPPDADGVPIARHARWLQESFEILWRQGARVILWLGVGDQPAVPNFASTYQSGVFFRTGEPKPASTGFRFPFVIRCGARTCSAWGKNPRPDSPVVIERRTPAGWRPSVTLDAGSGGVFQVSLKMRPPFVVRARSADDTSLSWTRR
jgi:hypothetical protein